MNIFKRVSALALALAMTVTCLTGCGGTSSSSSSAPAVPESIELTEVKDSDRSYPVGELVHEGKAVRIYGVHYKNFENLKEKWCLNMIQINI